MSSEIAAWRSVGCGRQQSLKTAILKSAFDYSATNMAAAIPASFRCSVKDKSRRIVKNIFIGDLDFGATESSIRSLFQTDNEAGSKPSNGRGGSHHDGGRSPSSTTVVNPVSNPKTVIRVVACCGHNIVKKAASVVSGG